MARPKRGGVKRIPPELLAMAYRSGHFPMGMADGGIGWFAPDPRGILPLDAFRVPHGLRRALKRRPFDVRIDTAFREVIAGCADREQTWINPVILDSYCRLHELGMAHSVEAWSGGRLAGGLYGVAIGGAFFGESMFHRETDASKAALVALVERLKARGYALLDIQWVTDHLRAFGAVEIPRSEYLRRLETALGRSCRFSDPGP